MLYQLNNEYFLRAVQLHDLNQTYLSWFQDQEITQFNSHGKFYNEEFYKKSFMERINNPNLLFWAICHEQDGHIGNISLDQISSINRNAELTFLIGNKIHWRKNISFLAAKNIINHGFSKINLNRIYCSTAIENIGMIKLAIKLGFKEEGTRRENLFLNNKFMDMIEFGLLKKEFIFN